MYLQIHMLTPYAASNMNRDQHGRPKIVNFGGETRLRVSSQCLKNTWRTGPLFDQRLRDDRGVRTRVFPIVYAMQPLLDSGRFTPEQVQAHAVAVLNAWGGAGKAEEADPVGAPDQEAVETSEVKAGKKAGKKVGKPEDSLRGQLTFLSPAEVEAIKSLTDRLLRGEKLTEADYKNLAQSSRPVSADIALFGRMIASLPDCNVDASMQVAHAFSVHPVDVAEDYFSAVDDLAPKAGAGHINETEYAPALLYSYATINLRTLARTLRDDRPRLELVLSTLIESMLTLSPTGNQNKFAHQARAAYALLEAGPQQPRSLASAYLEAVNPYAPRLLGRSVDRLKTARTNLDTAYGACADSSYVIDVQAGSGTLQGAQDFVKQVLVRL